MKQITNQQAIKFLNQLIERVDLHYADQIDNPKTRLKRVDYLESQALDIISDIQKTIKHISLY